MNIPMEIKERVEALPVNEQREVLDYVEQGVQGMVRRVSGESLLKFSGTLSQEHALEMLAIIEEGCGLVGPSKGNTR